MYIQQKSLEGARGTILSQICTDIQLARGRETQCELGRALDRKIVVSLQNKAVNPGNIIAEMGPKHGE